MTPFKALYGRDPPTLVRGDAAPSHVEDVNQMIQDRNQMLDELKEQLAKAQNRMKVQADKHRRELELGVGEKVYLKVQPYKLKTLARRQNQKLSPRFYGPFEVLEKIGAAAYKLQLPSGTNIHPVFHASLLKRCVSPGITSQPLPRCLDEDWELKVQPETVIAVRKNDAGQEEILVKWVDLPESENSWELKASIQQEFPLFHLGDKVEVQGGGIDKDHRFGRVYARKKNEK